jgi:hypothetical protein
LCKRAFDLQLLFSHLSINHESDTRANTTANTTANIHNDYVVANHNHDPAINTHNHDPAINTHTYNSAVNNYNHNSAVNNNNHAIIIGKRTNATARPTNRAVVVNVVVVDVVVNVIVVNVIVSVGCNRFIVHKQTNIDHCSNKHHRGVAHDRQDFDATFANIRQHRIDRRCCWRRHRTVSDCRSDCVHFGAKATHPAGRA